MGFLFGYLDDALKDADEAEAHSALKYAVSLYTPAELRTAEPAPGLARRARAVYRLTARRGAEEPSFFALAVEQRFGDAAGRDAALDQWEILERWVVDNGPYASEPLLRHEELERALEEVAAISPPRSSPSASPTSTSPATRPPGPRASRGARWERLPDSGWT